MPRVIREDPFDTGGGLGIGTIIVLGLLGYAFGIDPRILIGGAEILTGGGQAPTYQTDRPSSSAKRGAPTDEMGSMISGILGEIDDRWSVRRDRWIRSQLESLRAAGNAEQGRAIVQYRAAHRDVILGLPMAYGYDSDEMGGFLAQGHAYGLIRLDAPREFLLMLYCLAAHQYTRGTWTAPETRTLEPGKFALPYCAPAQVQAPLMTRWMLVFEEPDTGVLWLAKATPRAWLEQGQSIVVKDAPTRRGRIGYELQSRMGEGQIEAAIDLPSKPGDAPIKLRLRVPGSRPMRSVQIGGKPWDNFDLREETVTLPRGAAGRLRLVYGLNPMAGVIEGFRWALLGKQMPDFSVIALSSFMVVALLLPALVYFRHTERTFADIV